MVPHPPDTTPDPLRRAIAELVDTWAKAGAQANNPHVGATKRAASKRLRALLEAHPDEMAGWRENRSALIREALGAAAQRDAARATIARIESLARKWEFEAASNADACPDSECGNCTMGNLSALLRSALNGGLP